MQAFVGQTREHDLIRELASYGIGECTVRGELPARRSPWFYDNGAFADWTQQKDFDSTRFMRDLRCIQRGGFGFYNHKVVTTPAFVVLPDAVGKASQTFDSSADWHADVLDARALPYLAVQNGMDDGSVMAFLRQCPCAGLFVGGTLSWKIETAGEWRRFSKALGLKLHIGRVGTPSRVAWAKHLGADSIDSSFPLWSRNHLDKFKASVMGSSRWQPALWS